MFKALWFNPVSNIINCIFQQFLAPLQVACILPQNALNTIFSNVEAIQAVNRELLSHMETLGLGDAFLAMAPFIKLYSTYANNFAKAQADLQVKNNTLGCEQNTCMENKI